VTPNTWRTPLPVYGHEKSYIRKYAAYTKSIRCVLEALFSAMCFQNNTGKFPHSFSHSLLTVLQKSSPKPPYENLVMHMMMKKGQIPDKERSSIPKADKAMSSTLLMGVRSRLKRPAIALPTVYVFFENSGRNFRFERWNFTPLKFHLSLQRRVERGKRNEP